MRTTKDVVIPSKRNFGRKLQPNQKLEMYKLVFDLMKHITTLSSGAIIIVITMIEKVFSAKPPIGMFILTLGAFCISIVSAISAMLILSLNATEGMTEESDKIWFAASAVVATVGFGWGIIAIAIYAFVN